jgi:multiple sugar transport system substrate-binding protein
MLELLQIGGSKMKRLLTILLILAVATSFVCAQAAQEVTGKTIITYSYWGTPEESTATQAVLDTYNASQDSVKVELVCIPNEEYTTKLNSMYTSKTLPDTGIMNENGLIAFANNGLIADVSKMYANSDSKPLDCLAFKSNGKVVAYSGCNEILMLYYNRDMFDKAGLAYPPTTAEKAWTWEQFIEVARKLTLDVNGKHPGEAGFDADKIVQYGCNVDNWTWQLEVWAQSNGGAWFTEDGKKVVINSDAAIESIQKVADLYLVEHVAPYYDGSKDEGITRSIAAGNVAMATGGAWNMGTAMPGVDFNWGIAVLPYMKDKVTACTSGPQVVFSQTKHQKEAMDFIAWYTQEANNWGLIGSGIWMPLLEKYYTNEEFINLWLKDEHFPVKDYEMARNVLVDYTLNYAKSACWYYTPNTSTFIDLLRSVLNPVWTGEKTAKQAITENYDALSASIQDF